ncbi:helix-turn-helix transcriptional regulator [Kineosporia mesophila]|uniref:Helix-turn-helix transcriptional regulator n=1 Tax=Kineosporia mesophila TaxID=566012 RepID=A0ABP6ZC13_9ACTN|nr:helix-turn-helix transcriptional regulator [Kineosporia mesophila]MCD5353416.1 helix-turn-helix domain-containing protein [Kineosporia mesophila]
MTESGIGAVRRSLARQLREARLKSGVTYQHMKDVHLASKSAWARYENGQVRPGVAMVRYACEVFKVVPEKRDLLISLAEQADEPTWWEQKGRGLPTTPGFVMYLEMESFASQIQVFSPLAVPGLIQSPGYQHEQFAVTPGLTTSTAARLAEVRTTRQTETIGRARLSFVIGEEVLARQVGGAEGMRDQVAFMRGLDERDDVEIRVLPFAVGAHPGGRGEFNLLTFPDSSEEPPLVYVEGYLSGQYSSDPEVVADLADRFAVLHSSAVPMKEFLT